MTSRRKDVLDIREIVRRLRLRQSLRQMAQELGIHRQTLRQYRRIARAEGWLSEAELPSLEAIQAVLAAQTARPEPGPPSCVEPYREKVLRLRQQGVEVQALYQLLKDEDGFSGSYSSLRRFVRRLQPKAPRGFVRIEVAPGQEAQVDFGYAGKFLDPARGQVRRGWVFVMTLSFSRHQYTEIVFEQSVPSWIALHVRAFESFPGVPKRVVLDNLKAAITRACFHDPEVQRSYRELAEHYGFTIAPCRVATPEHKGKVESGVHYVKRNALAGRPFRDLNEANEYLRHWTGHVAGVREHGTTHEAPLARFEQAEKAALLPLPSTRYEPATFKLVKLHPDCHVVFEKAFYSAPHRLIGQTLWLRATRERVELYFKHQRVATHPRAQRPGERISQSDHYPPDKVAGLLVTPQRLREQAHGVGPNTSRLIEELLADEPVDRLRAAQGILSLTKKYGPDRLERACARALLFRLASYRTVASILKQGLDQIPLPAEVVSPGAVPKSAAFARPVHQIAAHLRNRPWN